MEGGFKSAEAYRATALLCRQQAACDPDNSWRLLGEAERWEYLAEQILASRQNRAAEGAKSVIETGMPRVAPSQPKTMVTPPRPPRYG
ncbi:MULTISPECIES: hypothetical protein [unclassified Bradyrhizobium]|uniref:hypothetical protein n=1 Tax=unclassified Bradyrhizobium TaxID=2631580 RepID=UPI001BA5DECE|nr:MULTISPECIES: hypothetical protein [unclassified Bradyrhizobium]MBR1224920.1 hypothetical protein [Bradyrhizobium sp. AUGA SZCCT0176]MBR1281795.1 hypothetical protein [Bradyrhizobium sp. AUGA SZCCT0177]MBR1301378.1 hypothetical protein [Bradyrhizobium sp. AUGA SZCCT0042]